MTADVSSNALFSSLRPLRLRIPGVIDVVLISEPDHIQWLNRHADIDRTLDPAASLAHRFVERRLRADLGFGGELLPVFRSRGDTQRGEQQQQLEQRFENLRGMPGEERDLIADYISGEKDVPEIGAVVQQWCGRLLVAHYRAAKGTFEAGHLLGTWGTAPPWRSWLDRRSGRLAAAKKTVSEAADGDLHCIHATTIAMENVVRTVRKLRSAAHSSQKKRLAPDDVLRECLQAPPVVLRGCARDIDVPFLSKPLTRESLVVFLVARAFAHSGDFDVAFLADGWSRCPAHRVLPEMFRAVWHAAHHDEAEKPSVGATVHQWKRRLNRAVS